jgi:hypothetical protein
MQLTAQLCTTKTASGIAFLIVRPARGDSFCANRCFFPSFMGKVICFFQRIVAKKYERFVEYLPARQFTIPFE